MSARSIATIVALLGISIAVANTPAWAQDELEVKVTALRHATFVLQFGDQTIIVDPVANIDYSAFGEPNVILITDVHPDHWNMETVAMLMGTKTKVVAPDAVANLWGGIDTVLEHEKVIDAEGILIAAVPMYNIEHGPREGELYHPEERGNGYVVHLGFERIYIAGDTECIPEMQELQDISMAFIPMNLPYTMSPSDAAECVKTFMPKVVYPYHYRGSDPDVFTWRLEDTPEIEVRILDWYPGQ
jgi:L-ascorbate metabolism protein UlaG (beta-lactamase superfamily)